MAASSSRSRQAPFLAAVVLILAALPVGWFVFLREPPAPPQPPTPMDAGTVQPVQVKRVDLELSTFEGTVEVRHGEKGEWVPAEKGMALRPTDAVRTGDGSYAVLVNGETFEVRMDAGTAVSVEELTTSLSRLLLDNGSATATVRGGKRHSFELTAKNGNAKASTSSGTFTMSNNGAGTVSVGTREGEVELRGEGKVVIVRPGQQSIVRPGQAPSEPAPVPTSILLKVNWPAEVLPQRELIVIGHTDPGNQVEVNGAMVTADETGRFERKVALAEGSNDVQVRARGVGGGVGKDQAKVTVKVPPVKPPPVKPVIEVNPKALWEKTSGGAPL
ncbi:FecR domain-containing protein [Corallococcus terminator]|uniref:FecR protein domain-containing protein n=1 Tax=Corallococcus terminator TaxID=2316733 RepID=A0A3A8J5V0_9BACT|nr:FecR domain-containing protein [Corallococcus terminator]RKG91029.1 hypothetical protein D7V88_10205 [Corallococcus terminator]